MFGLKKFALFRVIFVISCALASTQDTTADNSTTKQGRTMDSRTFKINDKVDMKKVTFHNRFGIELVGHLYLPKGMETKKLAGIAVCGPFGAVKEQASGLYAQEMAARGFVALAFDPSFTGESEGMPRYVASPDINTEDFQAAVDFLSTQKFVDSEKIGIIGICGFGGFALNAAALDTRIKATSTVTMYDMCRVTANGYFDNEDNADARYEKKKILNAQRIEDYKNNSYAKAGGVKAPINNKDEQFIKDYNEYYKKRAYHERSLASNGGWNTTSSLTFLNTKILAYAKEIRSAVLMIHGDKAHSLYFSEDAYKKLEGNNKELFIIPGAVHTDLYDNMDIIPFDKMEKFFKDNLG